MRYVMIAVAIVVVVGAVLWAAFLVFDKVASARLRRRREAEEAASGYYTVCVYSADGMRFRVRKPISERRLEAGELEIPEFLRK